MWGAMCCSWRTASEGVSWTLMGLADTLAGLPE